MINKKYFINVILQLHEILSIVSSRLLRLPGLGVCLSALSLLLIATLILIVMCWRQSTRKMRAMKDEMSSLVKELPVYGNMEEAKYQQITSDDSSDEFESTDRDYVNV